MGNEDIRKLTPTITVNYNFKPNPSWRNAFVSRPLYVGFFAGLFVLVWALGWFSYGDLRRANAQVNRVDNRARGMHLPRELPRFWMPLVGVVADALYFAVLPGSIQLARSGLISEHESVWTVLSAVPIVVVAVRLMLLGAALWLKVGGVLSHKRAALSFGVLGGFACAVQVALSTEAKDTALAQSMPRVLSSIALFAKDNAFKITFGTSSSLLTVCAALACFGKLPKFARDYVLGPCFFFVFSHLVTVTRCRCWDTESECGAEVTPPLAFFTAGEVCMGTAQQQLSAVALALGLPYYFLSLRHTLSSQLHQTVVVTDARFSIVYQQLKFLVVCMATVSPKDLFVPIVLPMLCIANVLVLTAAVFWKPCNIETVNFAMAVCFSFSLSSSLVGVLAALGSEAEALKDAASHCSIDCLLPNLVHCVRALVRRRLCASQARSLALCHPGWRVAHVSFLPGHEVCHRLAPGDTHLSAPRPHHGDG